MYRWDEEASEGYVSDEVNTLFSGLELKLARNSPITLVRMFVGRENAEVRGREYAMQQKFDPVREAILTGKDIEQMVMMPGKENSHADVLNKLENAKGFGVWRHMICITRIPNGLVAEVMLYGDANPMFVVLSKEDSHDFGEMDGYVCDWENRREMRFLDYLREITREDSELYERDEAEE